MGHEEAGTWDVGLKDVWTQRHGLGRVEVGLKDVGRKDVGTWGCKNVGTLECDKQTAPGFCAECVEYNFWWCPERYSMYYTLNSFLVLVPGSA